MSGDSEVAGSQWWVDEPVVEASEDTLGRLTFVGRLVRLLEQVGSSPSSTVVGLVGAWGSGKTSTVNLVVDKIDRDRWGVAKVNPWALSGPDAIVADVLAAVSGALPSVRSTDGARKALARYGTLAVPLLSLVPLVGNAAKGVTEMALERFTGPGTMQERTREVSAELMKLTRPVLVVIDDVDRLQPEELLALFKGVRVLGRLPHVHYLLAYDEQTVLDVLQSTPVAANRQDRALAFLEKIVTLRLDQPPTRPEQAERLFDKGLRSVLADAGVTITEDQRRRLADEREALLSRTLTEPRNIARFLAQLRAYLPLVGPGEVDIVDFAVLTFLRVTQPRLYQALATDQAALTAEPDDFDTNELQRAAWTDTARLGDLGVPDRDRPRVAAALVRLFPALDTQQSMELRTRRRDRRVSDPDHVERYFALTPPTGDLPDAVLSEAIAEWGENRPGPPGPAAGRVAEVLHPDPASPVACALAARVLRRAEVRSEGLSARQAAALLPVVLDLLPLPTAGGSGVGPEDAAVAWLARLLTLADGPAPAELLDRVARPSTISSPLWSLLRALRLALPEHRPNGPAPGVSREEGSRRWLSLVVDQVADAAWQRFAGHVELGNAAPAEPAGGLLRWLEEVLGQTEIDRRLALAVDNGMLVADMAARLVEVGTDLASGRETLLGFDASEVLQRLGEDRVGAQHDALRAVPGTASSGTRVDEDDVSWSNRRRVAAHRLLAALETWQTAALRLPAIRSEEPNPLLNHQPDILGVPSGKQPDLRAQVSVLVPAGAALPSADAPAPGPVGNLREQAFLDQMEGSPVTAWLAGAAQRWHVEAETWQITDTDGRNVMTAGIGGRSGKQGLAGPGQQTPLVLQGQIPGHGSGAENIRAGRRTLDHASVPVVLVLSAQVRTGLITGSVRGNGERPTLLMTITVGLWLAELTADRRPDDVRHSETPLPAALTLPEAYELLVFLARCTNTALAALPRLLTEVDDEPEKVLLDLTLDAPDGLAAVIDLSNLATVAAIAPTRHRQAVLVATSALGGNLRSYTPGPDDVAVSILSEWLLRSGYRGYEPALHNLWQQQV